ncbi:cupin domain-containing protein [Novosphingobium sp. MMS21-SN21R]|uniref:cupin domain-containing protein n=1 Tax=Novosphingobium sp. MMS21-SN21R TaxID=2969298 RepID=UPI0028839D4A|nr:cupin domain-containing protein [Novosphingobium sp. MMS21-SN21R]MDT0506961.1 cupin domain-containing protein [Novosphingobium sp. MMS21-SN21R]
MRLSGFDIDHFLRHHWQKAPLLIRNPWGDWHNPLEPDELAGLACDENVESRLVIGADAARKMENGPFPESRFGKLGTGPWTLLVQAVDHHVPDIADLIEPFRFVPDWRIDDVMVSYATDGGGVGSHYDQYDVFLVQGLGRRRWRVGPRCDAQTPLLPHTDLRLIADFEAADEWVLEPGDILYVPPGFAHDGVAVGDDCMTYSVGFRAPSRAELVEGWSEHQAERMAEDDRYADPDLVQQAQPGEITPAALDRLHGLVTDALSDRAAFARWFGEYNSLPKYDSDWRPEQPVGAQAVAAQLAQGVPLVRNPAARFAFIRQGDGALVLFADGQSFDCAGDTAVLAEQLCAGRSVTVDHPASEAVLTLIAALIDQGSLAFDDEDD